MFDVLLFSCVALALVVILTGYMRLGLIGGHMVVPERPDQNVLLALTWQRHAFNHEHCCKLQDDAALHGAQVA